MTLILGINCKDCIVMASDGITTTTSFQDWTQQPTKKKIEIFDDLIIGCAGSLNLNDKIMSGLNQLYTADNKFISLSLNELIKKIEYRAKQIIHEEIKRFKEYTVIFKKASEQESKEKIGFLIAFPHNKKLLLLNFDFTSGICTNFENISFDAIGWFSINTISFLSFIQKYLCKDNLLTKEEGIFSAMLAMKHAIDFSTLRLNYPIYIYVLENNICRCLENEELKDYENEINRFEIYLKNFKS